MEHLSFPLAATGLLLTGALVFACAQDPNVAIPSETPTLTGAVFRGPVSNDQALAQMTNARCTRNERCGLIGAGRMFATRDDCEREVLRDTASDFRAAACSRVKHGALATCVDDTTRQACASEAKAVMSLMSCKSDELCD